MNGSHDSDENLGELNSYYNSSEQLEETVQNAVLETVQNNERVHDTPIVQQANNSYSEQEIEQVSEQFLEQKITVLKSNEKAVIVAPNEDIEKWKHRVNIYYKRSIKKTSKPQTKRDNRVRYLEYKQLLESTGKYTVKERKNRAEVIMIDNAKSA